MSELVFINNNKICTDSLTVAEAFNKKHRAVLRDIRDLECSEQFRLHNFVHTPYVHEQNKQTYTKVVMTQDGFSFLVMGYSGKEAARFKEKYINAFNAMREKLYAISQPSYMITDPVERAKAWIREQEEKQQLELRAAEYEEKADYVDKILKSPGTMLVTQIAADYGLSAMALNKILKEEGVQRKVGKQWVLYKKYMNKGYTKSHTHIDSEGNSRPNTHWTQAGRLFIHEILKRRGIEALEDIKIATADTEAR
ncbi:phage regulatory protein/antirepressor Ant [Alkalihalobacillus clausii]|uniref:Rha family transcriptional regulator n=1 Tax=Shouchella clausii TaxID=79880 RepID=UPI001C2371C5|nr:phage regulatory protein/antirepressor Ant [Shouchella clausii]MBU8598469.1 phage regulatory protein/antirepressor Ant [Shouchella clausii]